MNSLFDELLAVHAMIRRDLKTVRELAAATVNGDASAADVRDGVETLKTNGPLWRLKVNCLRYCALVHGHHNAEDALLFPRLRASNPELEKVVDRLEADHRKVSDLLDDVEAAAGALRGEINGDQRTRIASALDELAEHLLEHLEFEEESVAEAMRAMPPSSL
jgi:Hemerythrin HHE cation binding domain